jgi:hypothetical protein
MSNSQVPSLCQLCCAQLPIQVIGGHEAMEETARALLAHRLHRWFGFSWERQSRSWTLNPLNPTRPDIKPTTILQRKMKEQGLHRECMWRIVHHAPSEGETTIGLIDIGNLQTSCTNNCRTVTGVASAALTAFIGSVDDYDDGRGHDSDPTAPMEVKWVPHSSVEVLALPDNWSLQPQMRVQQAHRP